MTSAIHPTAIVSPDAELGSDVQIGPFCIVEAGAILRDRVRLIAHVYIAGSADIGADTQVSPFAVLGLPPQDFKYKGEKTRLVIGERNVIREHVTMHPGTLSGRKETRVGSDGYFMVGSHIAHDGLVGNRIVMANGAALAGSVTVGDYVIFGAMSGVHQHTRIGSYAFIGALSAVIEDVIPYGMVDNDSYLAGLNIIGLKRRGFARQEIHTLRTAYRLLFADEGTFQERVEDVEELYSANDAVRHILEFIKADSNRRLCFPARR